MRRNIETLLPVAEYVTRWVRWPSEPKICDLGCGSGVFLEAVGKLLHSYWGDEFHSANRLAAVLTGVEIDADSASRAEQRLTSAFGRPDDGWDIRVDDALSLDESESWSVIIGNPPWVRLHHLTGVERDLARSSFSSAFGAFDLYYLFIEKALRLLPDGGQLAFVIPEGMAVQPSAAQVRQALDRSSDWTLHPLPNACFESEVGVKPVLLTATKRAARRSVSVAKDDQSKLLGSIAEITTGVPTGADRVFLVDEATAIQWDIEREVLRPAIRGRDINPNRAVQPMWLIWPYISSRGKWVLSDLGEWPNLATYLAEHNGGLKARPRLAAAIQKRPAEWFRFIDPHRHRTNYPSIRIAISDIFRGPSYRVIDDPAAVVLNTCFELVPKSGREVELLTALSDPQFWQQLANGARTLNQGFHRLSVAELRQVALPV